MTSKEPNKLKEDVPGESDRDGSDGEEEARMRRRKTRMSYGCVIVAWVWGVGFGLYRIHSFNALYLEIKVEVRIQNKIKIFFNHEMTKSQLFI